MARRRAEMYLVPYFKHRAVASVTAALQVILGHSSIVTAQRYAKLTDDHVRAEAKRIARIGGNSVAVSSGRLAKTRVSC